MTKLPCGRLLQVVYVTKLAPHLGTRRVHEVARRLVERGHEVAVLCAATDPDQPDEEVIDGIRVVALRTAPSSLRTDGRIGFLATRMPFYARVPTAIRRRFAGVDVVVEDVAPFWSPRLPKATQAMGVPLVYQIHNVYEDLNGWTAAYGPGGVLGAGQERRLRGRPPCDAVYSDAKWTVDSLQGLAVPVEWIPNGVDAELFTPDPARRPHDGVFRIVNVGRLVGLKNQATLFRALAPLRDRGVRLEVFGFGPGEQRLLRLIEDLGLGGVVEIKPAASRAELILALQRADLFCLPSTYEGMPMSAIEALACGLPVAMSDIPAANGLIEDDFGWRLPAEEPGEWTSLIESLLERPVGVLEAMGERGRAFAISRFDWDKTTDAELELFRSLLERSA